MGSDLYGQAHLLCKHGYYKTGCKSCKAEEEEAKKPCPHGNPKTLCVECLQEKIKKVEPLLERLAELEMDKSKIEQELREKEIETEKARKRYSELFLKVRELKKQIENLK